jgi:HlyD family secretion protein
MKQFFSKFSRRTWIIVGVIAVILLVAIFFFTRNGNKQASIFQTSPVERGSLIATVGATGSVRARQSAVLLWETTGIVDKVNVSVGDKVTRDGVLASLDKTSLNQSVIQSKSIGRSIEFRYSPRESDTYFGRRRKNVQKRI